MSTLFLLRHAQADYDSRSGLDIDRKLSPTGIRQAQAVARYLSQHATPPSYLLSSPAQRARQTSLALSKALNLKAEQISWAKEIYEASAGQLLACLERRKAYFPLILVGHNPGLEILVRSIMLGAKGDPGTTGVSMGTATLVQFDWPTPQEVLSYRVPIQCTVHAEQLLNGNPTN